MNYQKGEKIYEGKAKCLYSVFDQPQNIWVSYKDSLTAFNAQKKGAFENKGALNREMTSLIFSFLAQKGIATHWVADVSPTEMVVEKVAIIPLEVVVRNILAGSTAKKLGIQEGQVLESPLVEFYYKDDALGDPFVSDDQILMMKICSAQDLEILKGQARQINDHLKSIWSQAGLHLVDFKVEFGRSLSGKIILADEISPDCCRLWDHKTGEKMDKDRFRRDLGNVKETYEEVLKRLKGVLRGK